MKQELADKLNLDVDFHLFETMADSWKLIKDFGWEARGKSDERTIVLEHQETQQHYMVYMARYGNYSEGFELMEFTPQDIVHVRPKEDTVTITTWEAVE